ncbi:MAG: hypothetical protein CVT49_10710 [candidate division Zixibacteria bacterium HGW-Zixibacteria-1]|nr:MAG: hypothetical protein CVT49_10710 [candidate division Zixibacteria bacterium HGW-Zixibacteria-1]
MHKKSFTVLVCVFVLAFLVGALVSTAQAKPNCIATCLNGTWYICCPIPGGWNCYWGDACNWPGWIP